MKRAMQHVTLQLLIATYALFLLRPFALAQAAPQVKLPEGTEVRLKLMQALNSGTVQAGQTISFQVLDEIKVDDVTVIAEGAPAWGTVTEAEGKKTMGRGGKLVLQIDYVKAVDGSKIPLRANAVSQGKGRGAAVGVATTASVLFFWPAAPFFLLMKGKNVEIPRGQHVAAFVDGDRMINAATTAAPPTPATIQRLETSSASAIIPAAIITPHTGRNSLIATPEFGMINVLSEPTGAEIEVDGAYYGNTPGLLKLPAGQHTIIVRSANHGAWNRTLNIGAGSNLTVKAELTKIRRANSR